MIMILLVRDMTTISWALCLCCNQEETGGKASVYGEYMPFFAWYKSHLLAHP